MKFLGCENLFPTPIGFYQIEPELTQKEIEFIDQQEQRSNRLNRSSVNNFLFKNRKLARLRDFCTQAANDYLRRVYDPKTPMELYITQSWANWTEPGQAHHKHAHPNSIVSGVLYIAAEEDTDRIYFYRDSQPRIKMVPENWNTYNSESWWFSVATNKLILFPSTLEHMVENKTGEGVRISLAFNTFFRGTVGDDNELTMLTLP